MEARGGFLAVGVCLELSVWGFLAVGVCLELSVWSCLFGAVGVCSEAEKLGFEAWISSVDFLCNRTMVWPHFRSGALWALLRLPSLSEALLAVFVYLPVRLPAAVCLELSVWSCLFGAVCLELSVWSCLFFCLLVLYTCFCVGVLGGKKKSHTFMTSAGAKSHFPRQVRGK